jgi:S1-C subfamily serine protease
VVRDVIVGAGGQRVRRRAELASVLRGLEPGAPLVLRVAKPAGEVEITLEPVERTAGQDL